MNADFDFLKDRDKNQVYGDCLACLGYFAFNAALCGRAELERALAHTTRLTETPELKGRLNWWNSKFSNIQFAFNANGLNGIELYGLTLKVRKGKGRSSHPKTQQRIKLFALNYFLNDIERCKSLARKYFSPGISLDESISHVLFNSHKSEAVRFPLDDQAAVDALKKKSPEGAKKLVTHLCRERDAGLSRDAKAAFAKANGGKLFCQACGVEPLKVYGVEVIEAHHRIPLSKSEEGRVTEISDLIMLCPSCHRAVHRIPDCDFEFLKAKVNG
jgi:HNH endonuclease